MARLNGYLYQIGAAVTDERLCAQAKEIAEHFLFRCVKWMAQRKEMMLQCVEEKRGNLSFHLGAKLHQTDKSGHRTWTCRLEQR
jgi:hypothetical protein